MSTGASIYFTQNIHKRKLHTEMLIMCTRDKISPEYALRYIREKLRHCSK